MQVTLIGRPNVGKSTLFNRLIGSQRSIVEPTPGVTRDRLEGECVWSGKNFLLIDTGGISTGKKSALEAQVLQQVKHAISKSDLILFMASAEEGVTTIDEEIVGDLRKQKLRKTVFLVVNKVDSPKREAVAAEFFALGLGEPILISALHGTGIGELLDAVSAQMEQRDHSNPAPWLQLCIVGRPNVGKSSLLNALLGEPRVVVHDEPGTTRDAVDTWFTFQDKEVILVDTAGLRKRSKATTAVEFYSRTRTMEALRRSQVALLVLDASQGVLDQDKRIAGEIEEAGKGVVVLANKWDKLDHSSRSLSGDFTRHVRKELYFVGYAPILPTSAVSGSGVEKILPLAVKVHEAATQVFKIQELKKVLDEAVFVSPPPSVRGEKVRFKGVSVAQGPPLTFVLKAAGFGEMPDFYLRYLEGKFRSAFNLEGVPVRFKIVSSKKKGGR